MSLTLFVAAWALSCAAPIFHNSNMSIVGNPKPTVFDIAKMFGPESLVSSLAVHLLLTLIVFVLRLNFSTLIFIILSLIHISEPTRPY